VPNDSTSDVPPKACYEIDGTLFMNGRQRLLFNGNGAEFVAKTTGVSTNTVQLGRADRRPGWPSGLRPVGMPGAFDVPLGHLALDDMGVRAPSTNRLSRRSSMAMARSQVSLVASAS
jgi:hypothetical protein